jgi:hypothetical protein
MKTVLCALAIVCLSALAILSSSCDKSETASYNLDGVYVGIFSRTGMDTARTSISFTGSRFEGQSNITNYPAICYGSYQLDHNEITFTDSCSWTANFDWSLILRGTYNISFSDGLVRIWKTSGAVTDEYLLRQPIR